MSHRAQNIPELHDFEPENQAFLNDVLEGLGGSEKSIPCKYFYDERGSKLFDQICELADYYPTRTELAILEDHAPAIAKELGPGCLLIEYGSGSSRKTRVLLDQLSETAGYVPIDISREHLLATARDLQRDYPDLTILPVCADYSDGTFKLPLCPNPVERKVIYFPGSTIGNFTAAEAQGFLERIARIREIAKEKWSKAQPCFSGKPQ